jgi:hypothetical protein
MTDKTKTFVFDIDGTICTNTGGAYKLTVPLPQRIQKVNELYDDGHTIVFNTARGMGRFNNDSLQAHECFYDITKKQLEDWGVKYHCLFMGKPAGDLYVDDKGILANDYFQQNT